MSNNKWRLNDFMGPTDYVYVQMTNNNKLQNGTSSTKDDGISESNEYTP